MAQMSDLNKASRRFLERYPFPELGEPPFSILIKALTECRIALITTAGLHMKDDSPFSQAFLDSDCSFRKIPSHARLADMEISHTSGDFDRSGITKDLNVVFPIDRVSELVTEGVLGGLASTHYSFMGSLPRTGDLRRVTAPAVAKLAFAESVDIALLTPV
ncbi:MAG: glycine/betaine/sarcosine/D-proline family reductase selenoprotein B [Candidatus Obscuribacterales bacterium]|nr:glycine/betaine/sarcosine/D-proline family reductase selenoprotein B [Candidatus Obscuribacterales bacterium]